MSSAGHTKQIATATDTHCIDSVFGDKLFGVLSVTDREDAEP